MEYYDGAEALEEAVKASESGTCGDSVLMLSVEDDVAPPSCRRESSQGSKEPNQLEMNCLQDTMSSVGTKQRRGTERGWRRLWDACVGGKRIEPSPHGITGPCESRRRVVGCQAPVVKGEAERRKKCGDL